MEKADVGRIAYLALKKACKVMRENPPGDISLYSDGLMSCLIGGINDPEGKRFVNYFLEEAIKEYCEEKLTP